MIFLSVHTYMIALEDIKGGLRHRSVMAVVRKTLVSTPSNTHIHTVFRRPNNYTAFEPAN